MRNLFAFLLFIGIAFASFSQTTIYTTDFNASDESWTSANWVRGDVDFSTGASGNYWGYPNDGGGYGLNENEFVQSPIVDLSGFESMTLSIDIRYNTEATFDGFNIEYSVDGGSNWLDLGSFEETANWYNETDLDAIANGVDAWSGDNGSWQTATISLPSTLDNNCQAQFRLEFASDFSVTDVGAAFDNVIITGTAMTLDTPTLSAVPGDASETFLLWLQSDSAAQSNGANIITQWGDWSGNTNVAVAGDCGPTYTSNAVNGHAAVSFDGTNYMDLGDILNFTGGTDSWSLFIVYNTSTAAGTLISRAGGGLLATRQYQLGLSGSNFVQVIGGGFASGGTTATGAWNIVASLTNTSNSNTFLGGAADITTGTISTATESENVLLGARNSGADNLYTGDMAEVIAFLGELSSSKRRDVETYLAVKYGITLDIATQDYTVNGSSIFDNANFSGYNADIAGIGQDVSQGLAQATGISATGNIVQFSNASDLDDGEFMLWGQDGGATTTTTSNTPGTVTNRLNRIWRVSETGDVGTVSVSFDITTLGYEGRTFNLLSVPNSATIPTDFGTATVSSIGTVSNIDGRDFVTFSEIDLSDQQYFTLGLTDAVTGPGDQAADLWLKADIGVSHSSNSVSTWSDLSGNSNDATQGTSASQPTYVTSAINGNPAIDFDGGDEVDGSAGFYTHEYFIVTEPDIAVDGSANGFMVGFEPGEFGGFFVGTQTDGFVPNDRVVHAIGDSGDGDVYRAGIETGTLSAADQPIIWSVRENAGSTATEISLDGTGLTVNSAYTGNALINLSNQAYRIGDNLLGTNAYDGSIAEVISYNGRLSNANRRDVETYLAIKYGITLGDIATGYTVSGNTLFNNATYANDIAGIGRNDSQGLFQSSSQSISGNAIRFSNPSDFDDGEYLIWGHDGGAAALQTGDIPGAASVPNRLTRVWTLAEHDGTTAVDVGTVDLTFDLAGIGVQAGGTYELYISSTATIASGTVTTGPTTSGSLVTFSGVSVTDGDFFTLGVSDPVAPGDVDGGNLALWLNANRGLTLDGTEVTQWGDQGGTNSPTADDINERPDLMTGVMNGNDALSFDGGDRLAAAAGFYSRDYFLVALPSEIYNSGESVGTMIGFDDSQFGRLGLGPVSGNIANEVITHGIGNFGGYRSSFVSTTTDLNQAAIFNSREGTGAVLQDVWLNGALLTATEANTGAFIHLTNTSYQVGDDDPGIQQFPFNGLVAELVSYSAQLSADNRRDVETYLAIKYGITLDIAAESYTAGGSGNPIFTTGSAYSSDIAGIGINTSSDLNQLSSKSVNSGSMVRMESASDLADGEYLVWGNNGLANDFTTANVPPGVIEMLEKVWTVEETGDVGTVTISFDITALGIDIDNSTINLITMATGNTVPDDFDTQGSVNSSGTISNVDGRDIVTFNSVDFTDNDVFTIGGDIQTLSPGSSALELWLRADQGVTESSNLVSNWSDQSGNAKDVFQGNSANQPTFVSNAINYNPAIDFSGDNLENIEGFYTEEYFLVIKPDNTITNSATNGYVLGFETQAPTGFYIGNEGFVANDIFGQTLDGAGYDVGATSPTTIANQNVVVFNMRNNLDASPTIQLMYANGDQYTGTGGTHADIADGPIRLGNTFDDDRAFSGQIAELLSYSARLTTAQRRDVESYLAIKYGITLEVDDGEVYTADGTDIYAHVDHDFDIAGLGKHLDYGLNQTQSISQNTGAIIKMEGLSDLDDDEYLIWGYDGTTGGSKTTPDANEIPASFDERLPAEWRVDLTGSPGTVTVKIYVGGITNFSERPQTASLYSLLLNNADDFSTITSSVAASTLANDTLTFNNVSFTDGDRFTLALPAQPDVTGLTLWLKADTEVEEGSANPAEDTDLVQFWRDQSGNNNDLSQNTFAFRPTYSLNQVNGKPVVTFDDGDTYLDLVTNANLNPRSIFVVYNDVSGDNSTTPFTNNDADDGTGIGAGDNDGSFLFDPTDTPADVRNGDNFVNGTDIGDGTAQARPTNYELHSRVFVSNLSNATYNYFVGNDRGTAGTAIGGGVAEILVYTTALIATERRDVETYLALKYGITLDISSLNYTYNSGTSIYNLGSFSNDIAGIGSNSTYGFSQSSATSTSSDAIVTVSNPSSLASGDFLVWGNNNGATGETSTTVPPGIGMRVTRIWGVDETNDIGTVTVAFDLTGLGYGAKNTTDFSLIVDGNSDFSDGVLRTYSAQSFTSDVVTFSGVDFTSATNFGLGTTIDLVTDTDTDGIPDYFESAYGTNHNDGDDPVSGGSPNTDVSTTNGVLGDGISDALESILVTNGATAPVTVVTDTDGDGIPDHIEVEDGTDPYSANSPTSGGSADSDSDGIPDGLEALITSEGGSATPDLTTDTDSDGVPDYFEVMNGSDPNDVNSPTTNGGNDGDADNISDAMEAILDAAGGPANITATTDTDGDGIPDYVEAQTFTDPFNSATPVGGVTTIRSLQADYEATGGDCVTLSGYQWVDVTDLSGNIVFSINPFGNNLGSTCWGVRVLNGQANVRNSGQIYYLNRNWYIEPTSAPTTNVYVRLYSLDQETTDLTNAVNAGEGSSLSNNDILTGMVILKVNGDMELDPLVTGGGSTDENPTVVDFSVASGEAFVLELSSFSTLDPHVDASSPLPVELVSFGGNVEENGIRLKWQTATELNNDYFTLERSFDGETFTEIAEIDGAGNSSNNIDYEHFDSNLQDGIYFYRLKQTDFDGQYAYSETIAISYTGGLVADGLRVYPNPSHENRIFVSTEAIEHGVDFEVSILDIGGKTIKSQLLRRESNNVLSLDVTDLINGVYVLKIRSEKGPMESKFVIDK